MKGAGVGSSCEACNQGDDIQPHIYETRSYDHNQNPRNLEIERKIAERRAIQNKIMKRNENRNQIDYNNNRFAAAEIYGVNKFPSSPDADLASSSLLDESPKIRGRSNSYSGSSSNISNIEDNLQEKNKIFVAYTAPPKMDKNYDPEESSGYSSGYSYLDEEDEEDDSAEEEIKFYY